ncbi:MAG: hypothetical protein RJA34_1851 [Pseudomonadota bacterium]
MSELPGQDAPILPKRHLQGLESFRHWVRDVVRTAVTERWRECRLSDKSFEDWPLGESEIVAALDILQSLSGFKKTYKLSSIY